MYASLVEETRVLQLKKILYNSSSFQTKNHRIWLKYTKLINLNTRYLQVCIYLHKSQYILIQRKKILQLIYVIIIKDFLLSDINQN